MTDFELWLLALALFGLLLGAWSIVWARTSRTAGRVFWGRSLFVGTLVALGAVSLVAAFHRAEGLAPLGLSSGLLVIGMLWEGPQPRWHDAERLPLADEA